MRPAAILVLTAGTVLAADRLSKVAVVHWMGLEDRLAIDVVPPFLRFQMAWNRGVNFGLGAGDGDLTRWGLTALAVAISAALVVWALRSGGTLLPLAVGAVVGGALGNAWDRVTYGAVADFLNMSCCGIDNPFSFNIADAAIFAGAAALILMPSRRERA